MPAFPKLTKNSSPEAWAAQLTRQLQRRIKYATQGSFTLTLSATQTTISDSGVAQGSRVFFSPETAEAAAEVATTHIPRASVDNGSFVVVHSSNSTADRSFSYVVFEPGERNR